MASNGHKLRVLTGDREVYVDCEDILYLKSENVYVHIILDRQSFLMRGRLKEIKASLPENAFFQIHRSYIVNLAHICSFDGKNILLKDGKRLPVSGRRRELFRERIIRYLREK